jgi:hypothetical protein
VQDGEISPAPHRRIVVGSRAAVPGLSFETGFRTTEVPGLVLVMSTVAAGAPGGAIVGTSSAVADLAPPGQSSYSRSGKSVGI